ncbi:MAG: hypothetical protein PHN74_02830 [Candidatus Pacebacteria bacterium]|nr:hypothetical protein [Candidatus Paceibacterota bacterium]
MEKIIEILTKLKLIEPDENFKRRSIAVILNAPQSTISAVSRSFFDSIKFGAALALASLLLVVVFGGISILKTLAPSALTSLNTDVLDKELKSTDIQITLSEINYYSDSINKVAMVLDETSKNSSDILNSSAIEKESKELDSFNLNNKSVDELLNELSM